MPSRARAYQFTRGHVLRSHFSTLLALTALFLYTTWLYSSLRSRVHKQKLGHQGIHEAGPDRQLPHTAAVTASHETGPGTTNTARTAGRLVGSQLTNGITGGTLFSWGLDDLYRLGHTGGDNSAPETTLPHLQVLSVAASRHSLLLTTDGQILSMGPNNSAGGGGHGSTPLDQSGQLGRLTGSSAPGSVTLPVTTGVKSGATGTAPARDMPGDGALPGQISAGAVIQIVAGRYHSAAVTADGAVYTWGLNDWGQLGRVVHDAAGGESVQQAGTIQHKQGNTTAHNSSSTDSCSHGWSCRTATPCRVAVLGAHKIVAAAAGRYSTMVLDSDGQLWVWGYDGCATGDVPAQHDAWQLRLIEGQLKGKQVVAFDVGYTFWLAATAEGELYSCDHQDDGYAGTLPQKRLVNHAGQLGRSGGSLTTPGRVDALSHKQVIAVAAGREHAVVATSDGQVYTFGGGRAVLGREGPAGQPGTVLRSLEDQVVVHVAAGEYFSLAATESQIFAWGSNAYLCLGTGNTSLTEALEPLTVAGPLGSGDWIIQGIAAGYQHAFAVADKPGDAELAQLREESRTAAAEASAASHDRVGSNGAGAAAAEPGGVPGVEVVLTEQQLSARQKQQQHQHEVVAQAQPHASNAAHSAARPPATAAAGTILSRPIAAGPALTVANSSNTNDAAANHSTVPVNMSTAAVSNTRKVEAATQAVGKLQHTTSSASSNLVTACVRMMQGGSNLPADWHHSYLTQQLAAAPAAKAPYVSTIWNNWSPSPWHDQLVSLSGDVFALLPKHYNTMHKNPCWGGLMPELACLPYFNIIGVSKCGTTDLYHRLTLHKEILPASIKGPHFWDECPYPYKGSCQAGPSGDFKAYINLFSRAADLIRSRPNAITGEASSNTYTSANGVYLRSFRGDKPWAEWAGSAGQNATMPALLREAQPYLRLIVMFRNPVDRYYSAYHYYRWWLKDSTPPTPDDFHDHATREVQQWRDCAAALGTAQCVRRYQPQQLVKGMYVEFLQDWLRHFPRQQLLFLRYEDYIADIPQHLAAVLQFLDVSQPDSSLWAAMTTAEAQNRKQYAPMRPDTRRMLEDFYKPFNAALAQQLDADCRWLWADAKQTAAQAGHLQ